MPHRSYIDTRTRLRNCMFTCPHTWPCSFCLRLPKVHTLRIASENIVPAFSFQHVPFSIPDNSHPKLHTLQTAIWKDEDFVRNYQLFLFHKNIKNITVMIFEETVRFLASRKRRLLIYPIMSIIVKVTFFFLFFF